MRIGTGWRGVAAAAALALAATAGGAPAAAQEGDPVATIEIDQVQVSLLIGGTGGGGTLIHRGRSHPLKIGGIGVGGIGVSRLTATGEVWGLSEPADIEGTYVQLRAGAVAGDAATDQVLWIENASGVKIRLRAQRSGVALSLGGDAVIIEIED